MLKYVIVFSLALASFLTYTFPPLSTSNKTAALVARGVLAGIIAGCLGCGLAWSLAAVLNGGV